jgi:transcriptional regulator with XRE-family HTH domain
LKLYENIKACRKAAKMTQEELARRTGYTDRSSIARIEKGEIDLPQSKILQFAEALGTTPSYLMGWDEKPAEELQDMGALAAQVIMDLDAMEMMRNYLRLGELDRYTVRILVASLADKTKKTDAGASVVEAEKCLNKTDCDV